MALLDSMPAHLRELLAAAPAPGERNVWLFTVARNARHIASPAKVRTVLQRVAARWPDRDFTPEIERAIHRAYELPSPASVPGSQLSTLSSQLCLLPPWPDFNPAAWAARAAGPIHFGSDPLPVTPEQVIDALFCSGLSTLSSQLSTAGGDPLLCLALDTRSAHTQPRSRWRGLEAGHQFIVANPMSAATGLTQDGRESPRCLANAARRKTYQVVEFDRGTLSEQAAVLSSLHRDVAPLVLVVWSGGKSLHAWFDVRALSAYALCRFFRFAVYLGADASLWDPCKLVRLPGGRRSDGRPQPVLHFAPRHA